MTLTIHTNQKIIFQIRYFCDAGAACKTTQEHYVTNWSMPEVSSGCFVVLLLKTNKQNEIRFR